MPKFSRNKLRYSVNEEFFNRWTRKMAYILGFTFADGNIYKTSLGWDVQKCDVDILEKINKGLSSTYPVRQKTVSVRLRIYNQLLISEAINKGLLPKKSMRTVFPSIPKNLIRHFIRGYLDGDGWIIHRTGKNEVDIGFVSGNKEFLVILSKIIRDILGIIGKVRVKKKITQKGIRVITYQLEYYSSNAVRIGNWLYGNLIKGDLYLDRKYLKYSEARKLYDLLWLKTKSRKRVQEEFGKPLREVLKGLYEKEGLNGMQIAKVLETSKSSVYRWLEETGVKS